MPAPQSAGATMKPSKTDHDEYPEVTAADLRRGIVRKGFQPISAGPDAPEYFKSVVRRAGGLDNEEHPASLELRKIYETLPDADAEKHGQVRVIDESGEDYLYPATMFAAVDLPVGLARRVLQAA